MLSDLRHAYRTLAGSPGFTAIALLTLALGIGANTAMFSVVHGVLLRPLPFADPDRLVEVWTSTPGEDEGGHSARAFLDLQRHNRTLTAVAGYRAAMVSASRRPGDVAQLDGALVTVDFFDVLGVQPIHGRTFSRARDSSSAERLVVLGRGAWRRLFSDDPTAIGQRVRINGDQHTVVGVVPSGSEWPAGAEAWVLSPKEVPPSPLNVSDNSPDSTAEADDGVGYISVIGRLDAGVSLLQSQDDLRRVARDTNQRDRSALDRREIRMARLHERIVGDIRPALLVLQGAVGLVLLIACANISSLLLARTSGRRRELAIRAALGAKGGRLIRQLLTESLALGVAGGLAGLLLGAWLLALLTRVLPDDVPRLGEISLDRTVTIITFALALAASALFGSMPAIQASRTHAVSALRQGGDREGHVRTRGRSMLVVGEIALTLVLLVGAGLLVNSFLRLQRVDSGFRPEHTTVMSIAVPEAKYATGRAQAVLYDQILSRLSQRPEVQDAAIGFPGPLRGSNASGSFLIEGLPSSGRERPFANLAAVSSRYFAAMGIPLRAGRVFTEGDRESANVAVVNQAFARRYFGDGDPIGRRIRFEVEQAPSMTIVGVVGDARQLGLHVPAPPILYFTYHEFSLPFTTVVVRTQGRGAAIAASMRTALLELEPQLSIGDTGALQSILDRSIDEPRSRALLIGTFAGMALLLAAVGLYGLISFSVAQRRREIGIRLALGAPHRQVLGSVIREALTLTAAGAGLGLLGAVAVSRTVSRFLFGVDATDPVTLGAVCLVLLAVALLASYVPSRRALRVDPAIALRSE